MNVELKLIGGAGTFHTYVYPPQPRTFSDGCPRGWSCCGCQWSPCRKPVPWVPVSNGQALTQDSSLEPTPSISLVPPLLSCFETLPFTLVFYHCSQGKRSFHPNNSSLQSCCVGPEGLRKLAVDGEMGWNSSLAVVGLISGTSTFTSLHWFIMNHSPAHFIMAVTAAITACSGTLWFLAVLRLYYCHRY